MKKITRLKHQYQKCLDLDVSLTSELQLLSKTASEILGYDIIADMRHGGEIEFRTEADDII